MRYFFLLLSFSFTSLLVFFHTVPTYDLSVERSLVTTYSDNSYQVHSEKPKNIWYIGIDTSVKSPEDICIEWDFRSEKKVECLDNDGAQSGQVFTFPVLSDALTDATFRIKNHTDIDPSLITVYSIDTRTSGSRIEFRLPRVTAENGIISRQNWWADETLRYADSPQWKTKWPAYISYLQSPKTQAQLDSMKIESDRDAIILKNGWQNTLVTSLTHTENGHPLVWPIEKVKQVSRIILHHTAQSMDNSKSDEELIRGIYAYHTLSREWGDIGYNYLIGQRGKIYEGRAGWDYVVASHAIYNNMGTVGISVIWDFSKDKANRDQLLGIETAITMMAAKYGITLSDMKPWFRKCTKPSCSLLDSPLTYSLIGHQDVGYTDCPGSDIFQYIPGFITRLNKQYYPVLNPISGIVEATPSNQIMNKSLKTTSVILPSMAPPILAITPLAVVRYIGPKFRVKLSYPDDKQIVLATADGKVGSIVLDKRRIPVQASQKVEIIPVWDSKINIKIGKRSFIGSELRFAHSIVRIDSWNRIPEWDKARKYNDNLFRDTVRVANTAGKLLVVNDLPIEWYLKWLGEVSNTDLSEKIKVIVVAARSYARFYMDIKNRKFATNLYDGSDNPDEFQKYLGYGYEARSPNVAKLVDATRSQVIVYSGSIVKAWYHSSSDGRTLSALEYCQRNSAKNCADIPYLQSVVDPGSVWNTRLWHGVGISGIGATHWASKWWNHKKIIQYYMNWVEIQRK